MPQRISPQPSPAHTKPGSAEELMNTDGLNDPSDRGLWKVKAEQLSNDEKIGLSRVVDELAHWFDSA
jgi:hypothetical protein